MPKTCRLRGQTCCANLLASPSHLLAMSSSQRPHPLRVVKWLKGSSGDNSAASSNPQNRCRRLSFVEFDRTRRVRAMGVRLQKIAATFEVLGEHKVFVVYCICELLAACVYFALARFVCRTLPKSVVRVCCEWRTLLLAGTASTLSATAHTLRHIACSLCWPYESYDTHTPSPR